MKQGHWNRFLTAVAGVLFGLEEYSSLLRGYK